MNTKIHVMDDRAGGRNPRDPARLRAANIRTALVLFSIALVFFVGVIAARFMGGYESGMTVVGFGVFAFLCFAIGRNLRDKR